MNHLDMFSGIGGFAIAAKQVWGDEYRNIGYCEIDPFCQQVLKKHDKNAKIHNDIRELTRKRLTADAETRRRNNGISNDKRTTENKINTFSDKAPRVDLLTGGFPCQPFSQAGKRRGKEDDRYLWPEMLRVIKDFKPRWVIAENVRGLINIQDGVVFQQVCLDLEAEGYEVQPFIIPAVAVNAPHRRDRVWIVAHSHSHSHRRTGAEEIDTAEAGKQTLNNLEGRHSNAPDTEGKGLYGDDPKGDTPTRGCDTKCVDKNKYGHNWSQNWFEVATELCGVDDGLPKGLYPIEGKDLTNAGHRVERLKSLGNAIVPQVAVEIMRAIKFADENYIEYEQPKETHLKARSRRVSY